MDNPALCSGESKGDGDGLDDDADADADADGEVGTSGPTSSAGTTASPTTDDSDADADGDTDDADSRASDRDDEGCLSLHGALSDHQGCSIEERTILGCASACACVEVDPKHWCAGNFKLHHAWSRPVGPGHDACEWIPPICD